MQKENKQNKVKGLVNDMDSAKYLGKTCFIHTVLISTIVRFFR